MPHSVGDRWLLKLVLFLESLNLGLRFEANSTDKLNEIKQIVYEPISRYEVIHQMNRSILSYFQIEDHCSNKLDLINN